MEQNYPVPEGIIPPRAFRPDADHADQLDGHETILARGDALRQTLGVLADAA